MATAPANAPTTPATQSGYLEPRPRYIRAAYMSPGEAMLKETRATRWYYLPGPTFLLLVFLLLDYGLLSAKNPSWPAVPGLTAAFGHVVSGLQSVSKDAVRYFEYFLGLLTLLVALWFLVRYLRWMRTAYAVTTNRVIVQRGIFARDFDEIPVTKVRAVDVHQTALQRIMGYGTIRVSSEGESRIANEAWVGIPHPWDFSKLTDAAAQKYNQR
jgi:hypothetical protein